MFPLCVEKSSDAELLYVLSVMKSLMLVKLFLFKILRVDELKLETSLQYPNLGRNTREPPTDFLVHFQFSNFEQV